MSGAADYADTDHNNHQPPPAERRPPRPHVIKTALGAFLSLFCAASELSCSVTASAASAVKPHRISFNLKCVTLLLLLLSPGLFPRYAAMFVCWGQC